MLKDTSYQSNSFIGQLYVCCIAVMFINEKQKNRKIIPRSRFTSMSSAAGETCSMASQRTGRRRIVNRPRRKSSLCRCKDTGGEYD